MSKQNMNPMQEELKHYAAEHDVSDAQTDSIKEAGQGIEEGISGSYQKIEDAVVGGYKKIEDGVVGGYKKIEDSVVEGFSKVTDKFVGKLFAREGESVEDARKRLSGGKK